MRRKKEPKHDRLHLYHLPPRPDGAGDAGCLLAGRLRSVHDVLHGHDRPAAHHPEHVGRGQQFPAARSPLLHARRRTDERWRHDTAHHHHGHGLGRTYPRWSGLRSGGGSHRHGLALRFGGRRYGGIGLGAGTADAQGRLRHQPFLRPDCLRRHHRSGHPAVDRFHPLWRHRRGLDHQAVHRRHCPRHHDGCRHHARLVLVHQEGQHACRRKGQHELPLAGNPSGRLGAGLADRHHRWLAHRHLHAD